MTNMPRRCDLEHSDCHVGTVEVLRPFPNPVMTRAATNWASENDEHIIVAPEPLSASGAGNRAMLDALPITMMELPRKIVFRRPSLSPIQIVDIAPQKQPTLYAATAMPEDTQLLHPLALGK